MQRDFLAPSMFCRDKSKNLPSPLFIDSNPIWDVLSCDIAAPGHY